MYQAGAFLQQYRGALGRSLALGLLVLATAVAGWTPAYASRPAVTGPNRVVANPDGTFSAEYTITDTRPAGNPTAYRFLPGRTSNVSGLEIFPDVVRLRPGETTRFVISGRLTNPTAAGSFTFKYRYGDPKTKQVRVEVIPQPAT